jgi:hypothetical protein
MSENTLLIFPIFCLLCLLLSIARPLHADTLELNAGGGMLVINKADNLWAYGKKNINSLYNKPAAGNRVFVYPVFDLTYKSDRCNTEFYIDSTASEPGVIELGAEKKFDKKSSIDIYGFHSTLSKEWENPYVLHRKGTDSKSYGAKATYEDILGTNLSLSYKIGLTDVRHDLVGDIYRDLRRDGATHTMSLYYQAVQFFVPGVSFEKGSFKGKSNSYDSYQAFIMFNYSSGDFRLNTRLSAGNAQFDKTHPIFDKKRDEKAYDVSVASEYSKPFGLKHCIMTAGLFSNKTDSNIIFFEKHALGAYVSAGYQF